MSQLKNFYQFIFESEEEFNPNEMPRLVELGLIDLETAIEYLLKNGIPLDSIYSPNDSNIEIRDNSSFEDDPEEFLRPELLGWRGQDGEWLLMAKVRLFDESFDVNGFLSTGSKIYFSWGERGYVSGKLNDVEGRTFSLTQPQEDRLWYYSINAPFEQVVVKLLDATARLTSLKLRKTKKDQR